MIKVPAVLSFVLAGQSALLQPDPATSTVIRRLEALAARRRSSSEEAAMIVGSWFDGIDGLLADWTGTVVDNVGHFCDGTIVLANH